jgi:hypothetical protein
VQAQQMAAMTARRDGWQLSERNSAIKMIYSAVCVVELFDLFLVEWIVPGFLGADGVLLCVLRIDVDTVTSLL